jgi:ribosomal-protein-alanine N-acetyltransferase
MQAADVPRVVAIDRLSFPTPWSASSYLYELRHGNRAFYYVLQPEPTGEPPPRTSSWRSWLQNVVGLQARRQLIGYAGFRNKRPFPDAHISTIAIHPDWRGNGLGELLLLTTIEKARAMGFDTITLEVRVTNNVAQNLYRKYDFRLRGVHSRYYRDGEDALLMEINAATPSYSARLAALRRTLEARLGDPRETVGTTPWKMVSREETA